MSGEDCCSCTFPIEVQKTAIVFQEKTMKNALCHAVPCQLLVVVALQKSPADFLKGEVLLFRRTVDDAFYRPLCNRQPPHVHTPSRIGVL